MYAASAGLALAGLVLAGAAAARPQDPQEGGLDEATLELMSPGPMHAHLAPLVGSWDMATRYRMTPDGPWLESTAHAQREWVLDGRFVRETVEAEYRGQPFHGIGFFGYDNLREEYRFVWLDNVATGMMTASGTSSDGGRTIVFEGTNADPMTGEKDAWFRHVLRVVSDDENVFEMYARAPGGEEFQTMELRATRARAKALRFTPGSCCDRAAKLGGACTHACCVTARRQGRVCTNCN